jgi:hypothetical protein
MICGICKEREGEALTFCVIKDGSTIECQCSDCQPYRCKDCQEFWGQSVSVDGVKRPMHDKPQRRDAVMATKEKLNA